MNGVNEELEGQTASAAAIPNGSSERLCNGELMSKLMLQENSSAEEASTVAGTNHVKASYFIPADQLPILHEEFSHRASSASARLSMNGGDEDDHQRLSSGNLSHAMHVMQYHEDYLRKFLQCEDLLMRSSGPLSSPYRYFIAIMAASRHSCSYLVDSLVADFRRSGGDEQWLSGETLPKLRSLNYINKILAHRPWLLRKSDLEDLQKDWSISEIVHILCILAHFHGLCSYVFGAGLAPEKRHSNGEDSGENLEYEKVEEDELPHLLKRMTSLHEEKACSTQAELFNEVQTQATELATSSSDSPHPPNGFMSTVVDDAEFSYEDFTRRNATQQNTTLKASEFSWSQQGYSLIDHYDNELARVFDERFDCIENLTYNTLGNMTEIDTYPFRRAVSIYIHCLFGIRHDDYDYSTINKLLVSGKDNGRAFKVFIKTVACYPERVTSAMYHDWFRDFNHSEKVHILLLTFEARVEAELIYALRALTSLLS